MKRSLIEIFLGIIVIILVIICIVVASSFLYKSSSVLSSEFNITGIFTNAYGVNRGSPVVINGVRVGYVESINLNKNYLAKIKLVINKKINIPTDSEISIVQSSLLGEKIIVLELGNKKIFIKDNSIIKNTKSSQTLSSLINKVIEKIGSDVKK